MKKRTRGRHLPLLVVEAFFSVGAWGAIVVITVFFSILIGLSFIPSLLFDRNRLITHALAALWGQSLVRMAPGCRVRVIGSENIPQGRPVIFMANHQSYTDIPVLCFLRAPFKWMADAALFQIPFFGWAMRMSGDVPVRRGEASFARGAVESAKRWLARGVSVFIFPEGTRSHTGAFGRFQSGGFRLAAESRVPLVPVVLVGTRQLLPRGGWIFRLRARPTIYILPAVAPPHPGAGLKQARQVAQRTRFQMINVYRKNLKETR